MQTHGNAAHPQRFEAPERHFAGLNADLLARIVAAASDVALVVDGQGVIRDVSLGASAAAELAELRQWIGRRWAETVTIENRAKVQSMLSAGAPSAGHAVPPERQVTHALSGGVDLPISYSIVPLDGQGAVLALGRDLREVATVQQRLVDAQQSMERDYLRLRHTEARYRLLFEAVDEAVLVLDASSLVVFEQNAAASRLLGDAGKRVVGRSLLDVLAVASHAEVQAGLAQARAGGRCDELSIRLASSATELLLSASAFRQDSTTLLLVRLAPLAGVSQGATSGSSSSLSLSGPNGAHGVATPSLLDVVNTLPDAFVLTDMQGRILAANQAFSDMLQLPPGELVQGQPLDRWLGRTSVDMNVLIGNLRQHGVLRLFPTTMRSGLGELSPVEISAVAVPDGSQACLGFAIRDVARRLPAETRPARQLPRSVDQLTGLVGRIPLKDIVGETTDLIERLCIEAALELTRDHRASAAEMLGLSRQSLYVKLRRYGILGDGGADESASPH
ncbi:transcriptional regulator PpsR [Roseateles amylovorans]|uniref:Transcriptional regulator PpsR n=1 Tax=Roseateles amylovorans TaxID=2978473 RepID=A0ABY6B040_9BURK|nr:transcriptional regulator PpsR [Roseateles amylovorans]UXH78567.1 transcriptional regulator PpsR [Roseateles amylovorans]